MSNLKLAYSIIKLAQKILDNKPPTELEIQVAKEVKNITHSFDSKNNTVEYGIVFDAYHYNVRLIIKELWNGEVFAFYEFSRSDYPRQWTKKLTTKSYKGVPKKLADSIVYEIEKNSRNIIINAIEDDGFSQVHN